MTKMPNGDFDIEMQSVMLRVLPIATENDPADYSPHWFAGHAPGASKLKTLVGMSGGPIYGFRRTDNGQMSYHVVAIQSMWRERSNLVFGCSVPFFAEALHQIVVETKLAEKMENLE